MSAKSIAGAAILLIGMTAIAAARPATVTTDLNMREGPGTNHRVIMVMPRGATVDLRGCQRNWCEIAYANRIGFASQTYLRPLEARPPAPPAPPPFAGPRPPFWGGPPRPPRRELCDERDARWALGRWASERTVEAARRDANARAVRVIRPGDFYTQDLRRDRLNVEVNHRNRIVDLRCG